MPITRTFLGLQRPALAAVAGYLVNRFDKQTTLDLRDLVVVVH